MLYKPIKLTHAISNYMLKLQWTYLYFPHCLKFPIQIYNQTLKPILAKKPNFYAQTITKPKLIIPDL